MEFTLKDVNVFNKDCTLSLDKLLKENKDEFDPDEYYDIDFTCSNKLLKSKESIVFKNSIIYDIEVYDKNNKKKDNSDIISDMLDEQLGNFDKILSNNKINAVSLSIGLNDIKKFSISVTVKKCSKPKGNVSKCYTIIPNIKYSSNLITNLYYRNLAEKFINYSEVLDKDTEIISKVLGIEQTDDWIALSHEFCKQYNALNYFSEDEEEFKKAEKMLIEKTEKVVKEKYKI